MATRLTETHFWRLKLLVAQVLRELRIVCAQYWFSLHWSRKIVFLFDGEAVLSDHEDNEHWKAKIAEIASGLLD